MPSVADHDDPGRTGWVLNPTAFFDGVGSQRALDRDARTGQIVPVNRVSNSRSQDFGKEMLVAWYKRNDLNVAWPGGSIAVMGAEGAAKIIHRGDIASADDPEAELKRRTEEYEDKFNNPYRAAARGYIDDVIEPRATRPVLIRALELFRTKSEDGPKRKHGNIPL